MLTIVFKYKLSLITYLRCFHETLSGSGVDKSLHFMIVLLNSYFKKRVHSNTSLEKILSKTLILI